MARGEGETTEVREEEGTEVEGRRFTTQATSPAQRGGASLESGAKVATLGMSQDDVTAAGQLAGGALMTTWTVTVVSW